VEAIAIIISPEELAAVRGSADDLRYVKFDAIQHAERAAREGRGRPGDVDGHRAELAEIEAIIGALDASRGVSAEIAGRHELLDEIVRAALVNEGEALAEALHELRATSDPGPIRRRLHIMSKLLITLERLRE
jgi:hypothetical protein